MHRWFWRDREGLGLAEVKFARIMFIYMYFQTAHKVYKSNHPYGRSPAYKTLWLYRHHHHNIQQINAYTRKVLVNVFVYTLLLWSFRDEALKYLCFIFFFYYLSFKCLKNIFIWQLKKWKKIIKLPGFEKNFN